MPTSVHHPGMLRTIFDVILFLNWQGVHIGADQQCLPIARLPAPDQTSHPRYGDPCLNVLDPQRLQPLGDKARGLDFLESQLRMLVQEPPIGNHPRQNLVNVVA